MLVKSDFISKLVIKSEASNSKTSVNKKEFFTVYTLFVSGLSNWSQNLATLYLGVSIADKIGQNDGIPASNTLWILARLYRTPDLEPD